MKFKVFLHGKASKFLEELTPENKQRIIEKLRKLKDFPKIELDTVKVAGEENTFRLREGKNIVVAKIDIRKKEFIVRLLIIKRMLHFQGIEFSFL